MKPLLILLVSLPLVMFAADSSAPKLVGIVKVGDKQVALLEKNRGQQILITAGQREENLELLRIQPDTGAVEVRIAPDTKPQLLKLSAAGCLTNPTAQGFVLESVEIRAFTKLLGEFSERTILLYPSLVGEKFSVNSSVSDRTNGVQVLKDALEKKQIALVPDGDRFLWVMPQAQLSKFTPRAAQLPKTNTMMVPSGSIVFEAAHLLSVLTIYADYRGSSLDQNSLLSGPDFRKDVFLIMQTPLTKEECLYAMETVIGWHGIKLVPTEAGQLKTVAMD